MLYSYSRKNFQQKETKNVIFIIGDGMGFAQIHAGMVVNGNKLEMEAFRHIGLVKTYSHSHFTTDSGAGGTALACGVKTNNGMIGMGPDLCPCNLFYIWPKKRICQQELFLPVR